MGDKERILETIQASRQQLEEAVAAMPKDAWTKGVHENGWNAKQLLCHLACGSPAGFIIGMAGRSSESAGSGTVDAAAFDIDGWNQAEVEKRQAQSIDELLAEARAGFDRDLELVKGTPAELLSRHYKAPWGAEGSVADVIVASLSGHTSGHVAELRTAIS
jgi:uncharacterized damage-inducible protein DinB